MPSAKQQQAEMNFNNYLIIVILVCVLAVGATVFAGRIMVTNLLLNQKIITAKTNADDQLSQNIEAVAKLKEQYKNLGATADFLNHALPTTADYPGLVSTMANIAAISGLRLKDIGPAVAVATLDGASVLDGPESYGITLSVDGSYATIQAFLKNLELSARPFRVASMTITGSTPSQTLTIDILASHQKAASIVDKMETIK